jgi:hypothetical protein
MYWPDWPNKKCVAPCLLQNLIRDIGDSHSLLYHNYLLVPAIATVYSYVVVD